MLASRVPQGRILSAAGSAEDGILTAGDLPPHRARVLMMLALLEERPASELQRLLDTH
ncbi:MAG: hypothetical protein GWO22_32610 [Actinobacteria bacterium]|nr:hypothetical protein [Actinomycetota bacterium]